MFIVYAYLEMAAKKICMDLTLPTFICAIYNGLNALGKKRSVRSLDLFKEEHTGVVLKFTHGLGDSSEGKMSVLQT